MLPQTTHAQRVSEDTRNAATLRTMTPEDLDAVMAIEQTAYSHPWSRGNFRDSLNPLFDAHCLWLDGELLGYFLAMHGVEEMHLLNITVAPSRQGQGWGHMMLDALSLISRSQGAQWLWLEVRQSNVRALQVYERYGFRQISIRKDYYPAGRQQREHAVVMSLKL
ncbi:ribosomal protein S18-alanine N-acetyltransferase [Limnohabitans sp. JUR4]|uniref:[Ribosomal protein bS18]-alanine N-acetyltransferase n=2 Tax=Limnohabitans radicicola TaxID=2771427 RepID=A0A927FG14_9BURK|nr:ribosomal protein S18-alanine N-acetyltransferase [Limnohabitans radicicola]